MTQKLFILTLAALVLAATPAAAGGKSKAAQEAAEFVLRKFGRKAAKNGASALARRIERAAVAHGDDVFKAVRKAGPAQPPPDRGGRLPFQAGRPPAGRPRRRGRGLCRHPAQGPATRSPAR